MSQARRHPYPASARRAPVERPADPASAQPRRGRSGSGRHRRARPRDSGGAWAALAVAGIITAAALLHPFTPEPVSTRAATSSTTPFDLGPLPFDTPPPATTSALEAPATSIGHSSDRRLRDPITKHRPSSTPDASPTNAKGPAKAVVTPRTSSSPTNGHHSVRTWPQTPSPRSTLPAPPRPAARLVPASIALGAARSGTVTVDMWPGYGTWSAEQGEHVTLQSDGTVIVDAPRTRKGCPGQVRTTSETLTVSWRATAHGDGITSTGATHASGTLRLTVSWTTVSGNSNGDGYRSRCDPRSKDYPDDLLL